MDGVDTTRPTREPVRGPGPPPRQVVGARRQAPTKRKSTSAAYARAWAPALQSEAAPVKKPRKFRPLHSRPPANSAVREHSPSFRLLYLIISPDETEASAVSDRTLEDIGPSKGTGLVATVLEKKSDWAATASATARLLLHGIRDSADAFGPLKTVAGGLCFILDNCEVRTPHTPTHADRNNSYAYSRERRKMNS
jgi:hypothetical protein